MTLPNRLPIADIAERLRSLAEEWAGVEANERAVFRFDPNGLGFTLDAAEAAELASQTPRNRQLVRPYVNGRDLAARPRNVWIIDVALLDESEAREFPVLHDLVRDRVKPVRDSNARVGYRNYWWRFAEARPQLRDALRGLERFVVTVKNVAAPFLRHAPACTTSSRNFAPAKH